MNQEFVNLLGLMALSVVLVWIFKRIRLPAILAYLFAGLVAGPQLLGLIEDSVHIHILAEVGIVFLLFSLGLEFSLPKMIAMRKMVFGIGFGQMFLTTALFAGGLLLFDFQMSTAIIIGGMIALSSTAIVIKQIDELGRLNTPRSQMAVSILLFQDLAVVPFLIAIPLLSDQSEQSMGTVMLIALLKGVAVVAILLSFGRWLLPRIFNEVAKTKTDELFVLTTILIALLAAGLTYSVGLSMALGAFLAGMMLSESQYRHQLESDIRPFRDILMGLFFITVGTKLQLGVFFANLHFILVGCAIIIFLKVVIVRLVIGIIKTKSKDAWATGIKLSQMGEFSFVLAALAAQNQVITQSESSILISIGVLSMAFTPWLINKSDTLANWLARDEVVRDLEVASSYKESNEKDQHVIIIGFGRVGQSVARMLKLEVLDYIAIDMDAIRVHESRQAGEQIIYGDGSNRDILKSAGTDRAKLALITFDNHDKALKVINTVSSLSQNIKIVVRTRKDYQVDDFYEAGVEQVVPEIQEGSLMLVSQVLHYSGIPMSRILKRVRNERKKGYEHMHGFFPGETTELSFNSQDKLEFMHAVVITEDAFAIDKSLHELELQNKRITINGLRRAGKETEFPSLDTVLQVNDVLVISGKPRRVERIEKYLLNGG